MDTLPAISEAGIRLITFLFVFAAVATWETVAPVRKPELTKAKRWGNNLVLAVINTVVVRVLFPLAAAGAALAAAAHGWGLFNTIAVPTVAAVPAAVIVLDAAIWLQHRLFHAVPLLWRLHRVHHADIDFDVTTGVRFHPIEIVLSMLIKIALVILLGAPVVAVVAFELILSATSLFNHANASLPPRLERWVRALIVTPDMHRIHHSIESDEMNRNFGFNLSVWDRLFGTYREAPRKAYPAMTIGLPGFRGSNAVVDLARMLRMPFARDPAIAANGGSAAPRRNREN